MSPRTIRLLCACVALVFSLVASAAPSAEKPEYSAWKKKVFDSIGAHWYRAVENNVNDLSLGTVRCSFRLSPDGRVENLKVVSNTSNRLLADISVRAIKDAKLPQLPKNVLKEQGHNWIDGEELTFSICAE
jgi:outer membrane biosynthesis protein TonB